MDNIYQDKLPIDELMHYGVGHDKGGHSGRYPWGSGEDSYQHCRDFMTRVNDLKSQGYSEREIAEMLGIYNEKGEPSSSRLRVQYSLAKDTARTAQVVRAKKLREEGMSLDQIAKEMGFANDSSVRALLNEESALRMNQARATADFLKKQIDEKGMIDVGAGIERELGISSEKLKEALYILELEGYPTYGGGVPQATNPGQQTNLKVVCPPGTEHKEIYNYDQINYITDYISYDNGQSFQKGFIYPESLDSSRLKIVYGDEKGPAGTYGVEKDGVIELRRGVEDISLGDSTYAQVRILVDGTHYLKGMAMYSDDIPDGYDVMFNTNKKMGTPIFNAEKEGQETVLKKIKNDPDNPFGALIKEHGGQRFYDDPDGKYTDPETGKKQSLSLINKRAEEGDWDEWSRNLSAQFLSKQNLSLIKKQLNLSIADKEAEFDEINSLTNPTVKKLLLESFADDCDSTAVNLKAAAFPRQSCKVILPCNDLKENEVYAPTYKNGETVALIRYPHAGTFEIPVLTVNNKNSKVKNLLGNIRDAIGINSKTAAQLSGADFDGDSVVVIPCNSSDSKVRITSKPYLEGLKDFDPGLEYPYHEGMKLMTKANTQMQMGIVSNLITDMTLKGASEKELTHAVKHSMVVIDAEKHKLDWKKSELENGIAELKSKYQGSYDENGNYHEGAGTIVSRAKSEQQVLKRKGSAKIDPNTGEKSYKEVVETYVDKNGKTQTRMIKSTKMAETKDAFTLVSDRDNPHPKEVAYADYANRLKSLANQARKEMVNTGNLKYSASAKETYQKEVDSLTSKLNVSLKNQPKERQAQLIANTQVRTQVQTNPGMTKAEKKKASQKALTSARLKVGAKRETIEITDREWDAIQAGAITENKLSQILRYADIDKVRQRATPRTTSTLSTAKIAKIKSMQNSGYSISEIAESMNVSATTVSNYLK